jgi:hypothetical protein
MGVKRDAHALYLAARDPRVPLLPVNSGRRFLPPWSVEKLDACLVVRDQGCALS